MLNKQNHISLIRKTIYGVMLAGMFLSAFVNGNLPVAQAQAEATTTPTQMVQAEESPSPEAKVLEIAPPPPGPDIVGGAPADPGEYPWQVALVGGTSTDLYNSQFCGGSLIDPEWVLTAAHCITESDGSVSPVGSLDVVAGIYDLATPAPGYQRRDVIQIIRHPSYVAATYDNDLALLKLAGAVTIGGSGETETAIIPLVPAGIGDLTGVYAWVTGWGNTESVPLWPEQLHEVQVPIIANSVCNDASHYNGDITANMLCAGYDTGGYDSCQGDSGGPLIVSNAGQWNLAGIVSWGVGCADPYNPGVYTRVSQYVSWVNTYVTSSSPGAFFKTSPSNGATGQSTSPTLSWDTSSGATSYEYCYDTTNDNACASWISTGTNTSANLSGLNASTTYYWQVRANNTDGTVYANGSSTAYWSFVTAAGGATFLQDSSFEAYTPNPYWMEASTTFGTPLCTVAACGNGGGTAGPRTGAVWGWFGGIDATEIAVLEQSFTIPSDASSLLFYLWIGSAGAGSDASDVFTASIDGTTLFTANATQKSSYKTYTPVWINIDAFADGNTHTLTFMSSTTTQVVNFNVDDVYLAEETFLDVPSTHPYYAYIEALYANGLTNGCNLTPRLYCPDMSMNRAQIAKFFMTVQFGGSYLPPSDTPLLFQDNWNNNPWAQVWANDMLAKGLTNGCNASPLLYCPDVQIPREQVAKFALAIKHGNAYLPPPASGTLFADLTDVNYWATAWAEQAYLEGLVPACGTDLATGKPKFCPAGIVDRGFASFVIVTATGLLSP